MLDLSQGRDIIKCLDSDITSSSLSNVGFSFPELTLSLVPLGSGLHLKKFTFCCLDPLVVTPKGVLLVG